MESNDNLNYENFIDRQEQDRKRIANELHDTSLQNLTHIIHQIDLASLYMDVDLNKAKLELEEVNVQLRKITQEIRNVIFDLRPMSFDDLGFIETVRQYTIFIEKKYSVRLSVEKIIDISGIFDSRQNLEIYRVIQECLINSAKHSKGNLITLAIYKNENSVMIEVCDNGVGFLYGNIDSSDHYGLEIMNDRIVHLNGSITINKKPYRNLLSSIPLEQIGTCINISLPINN